jgi:hypothetical protein
MSKTVTLFSRIGLGDDILAGEVDITAGKLVSIDETFTSEDVTFITPIDVSALKAIFMVSDANLGITYDESGGPHLFSHSLTAGVPFFWHNASGLPNPFGSTDVVDIVATQVGSSCRIQIMILTDPTP